VLSSTHEVEADQPGSGDVSAVQLDSIKSGVLQELRKIPIKVAAAGQALPHRSEARLPFEHSSYSLQALQLAARQT
jgi:hypothetical protein